MRVTRREWGFELVMLEWVALGLLFHPDTLPLG